MEISIRTAEILTAQTVLNRLKAIKMKGVYGLTVARLLKKIDAEAATIFENRNEVLKKRGVLVLKGAPNHIPGQERYDIPDDEQEGYVNEVEELNEAKITISFDPLPPGLINEVDCEPEIWAGLLPFLQIEIDRQAKEKAKDEKREAE